MIDDGEAAGYDQRQKEQGKLTDFRPVHLAEAQVVEKAMAPVKYKEHGKKGNCGAKYLADGPAVEAEVAMKEIKAQDDGDIAEKGKKNRQEKLFFGLQKAGKNSYKNRKEPGNNELTSQRDG